MPELDALGDPTRRAIFEHLADGPRRVGDLARGFPISRPAVSQHLRVLKAAGLVVDRPDGQGRIYAVNGDGVAGLIRYFEQFWTKTLDEFKRLVDEENEAAS
jgi:DNA-binding transcriptional ArsR family regulator